MEMREAKQIGFWDLICMSLSITLGRVTGITNGGGIIPPQQPAGDPQRQSDSERISDGPPELASTFLKGKNEFER